MIRIAICEDVHTSAEMLEAIVSQYFKKAERKHAVCVYHSGVSLLDAIEKGTHFDICLLDIMMKPLNGMETAHIIREKDKDCVIVFLTASSEFAVESYKVKAFNYLLKPYNYADISATLDNAVSLIENMKNEKISLKINKRIFTVEKSNILYVQSNNHIVTFYFADGIELSKHTKIDEIYELLGHPFLRCHKSYLVNMQHITNVNANTIIVKNSIEIPISKSCAALAKKEYAEFLQG